MNLFRRIFGSKQEKEPESEPTPLSDEEAYKRAVEKTMEEAAETKPMLEGTKVKLAKELFGFASSLAISSADFC